MNQSDKVKSRPSYIALRDIAEELKKVYGNICGGDNDIWIVTPSYINNKETRRLNAELGLRSVNRNSLNMNRHKKTNNEN